jgi:chromosome segregation ATPase
MNRVMQIVNCLGVLALAVLCGTQWRVNGDLNRQVSALERTRIDLTAQVAQRDQRIREDAADLDDFRNRLTMAEGQLLDLQRKVNVLSAQCDRLTADRKLLLAQRDQLLAALETWKAAVAARDAALKSAGDELKKVVAERDQAVGQFNDLADKYNAVVKQLNDERSKQ